MNYLGHYVFNHHVCGIAVEPHFVVGVMLPDLWPRFSRKRRIRWKAVRDAAPRDPEASQLRAGLLNHVAADQRFHTLPSFVRWLREIRDSVEPDGVPLTVIEFLSHIAIELVLDQRLVREDPSVAENFYDVIAQCDYEFVARHVGRLGRVDTAGLADELHGFVQRRYLPNFARDGSLVRVMHYILGLTSLNLHPPGELMNKIVAAATRRVDPARIWAEMRAGERLDTAA